MNLLRLRIDYGNILTFMMGQRFITVVVRSVWFRHRHLSTVKWLSYVWLERWVVMTDKNKSLSSYIPQTKG